MALPEVVIRRASCEPIVRGHPWVFRGAVERTSARSTGEEVAVVASDGQRLGRGIYDPASAIAVRVWTRGSVPVDETLVRARLSRAVAIRARLFSDGRTTAHRLVHGEGDRMPGVVIDRYAHVGVVRADGEAAEVVVRRFCDAIADALAPAGIGALCLRSQNRGEAPRLESLVGPPPPAATEVAEHGVPFVVDLAKGQKTGAFLDQRENRRRVGALAGGRSVLNLFSYAGGFSLHAALGGARRVTSVDVAAGAHATAQASFRCAGVDPGAHDFVTADAFAFLRRAHGQGSRWDLVVSDPPSFAPNEKSLGRALASYRALHRACADVLAPGGVLCAASCSSHVDATAFAATLDDAALGRTDLSLLELFGAPGDHPTLAAWPEGRYLKFGVLA